MSYLLIHKLMLWSDTTITMAFPDLAPLQTDRKTHTATARRPRDEKETDIQDAHQSLITAPAIYMCAQVTCGLREQHFLPVCVYSLLALSQAVCVRVCVCKRRREALTTLSGKYLGWFPLECLGVPMECRPPPLLANLSFSVVPLSSLQRGGRVGKTAGRTNLTPCFVTKKNGTCTEGGAQMRAKPQGSDTQTKCVNVPSPFTAGVRLKVTLWVFVVIYKNTVHVYLNTADTNKGVRILRTRHLCSSGFKPMHAS